jgi:MFS family permease
MQLTRLRSFALLWLGQALSLVGSGLTAFALGVHVYQTTRSVGSFALIQLLSLGPAALLSPFAGALTDRRDRRRVLIASDLTAALVALLLAWSLREGRAELWQIGLAGAAISTLTAFQWQAFSTLTTLIMRGEHLGRATGATELARGVAQMASPVLAGLALGRGVSVGSLLVIDGASYLFAAAMTRILVRGSVVPAAAQGPSATSLAQDIARGWRYLTMRPELLLLWGFVTFTNLSCGIVEICITPRILSIASPAALGGVALIAGLGMLLGGVLMSVWRGAQRPVRLILMVTLLQGMLLVGAGVSRGLATLTAAATLYMFSIPIGAATNQAIWLRTVPAAMQGSVLGLRRAIEGGAIPLAALLAGPLVEHVFEPLVTGGGALAGLVEAGPGRAIALMYVALGAITVIASALALALARDQAPAPIAAEQLS